MSHSTSASRAEFAGKPRVLLDCDGVLADFIGGVLPIVADVTGRLHRHEQVDRFDFCDALNLTAGESSAVKRLIGARAGFCASLKPLPDARHGVRRLQGIADVYVVTSPWNSNATWTSEREEWLLRHFGIPHARVIHTSAKHVCGGDFLIDDKGSTLVEWKAEHPLGTAVHWDSPHNRHELVLGSPRISSWDELTSLIGGGAS